ncbi:hypothetical protein RB2150_02564 [Rhodobacteraceae bacterium HTCC2150]|nr:hypothetical protein RB2150_02564 [Rhodobacteraceae bacterium HTCC2150]
MKKYLSTTALLSCLIATPGLAEPTFSLGLSVPLGGKEAGSVGISAHVLSGKKQNTWAAAAGVTYFPKNKTWGVDIGVGRNFRSESIVLSYDFIQKGMNFSLGWSDLDLEMSATS